MDIKAEKITIQVGKATVSVFRSMYSLVSFTGEVAAGIGDAIRHPRKIRWKDTFANINVCGSDGIPITLLICLLTGLIVGYQAAIQLHKYGGDVFLPMLVGCTMLRELSPLMVAVMVTGRSGSAFAAEIATMKVSEELDALATMGLSPVRFLVMPKLIAMLFVVPLLTVLGDIFGILGGLLVGVSELNMSLYGYMVATQNGVRIAYLLEGLIKSEIFAWLITTTGCWCGFQTSNDAIGVGRSTTCAVVSSILLIVLADAVLAKVFAVLYMIMGV